MTFAVAGPSIYVVLLPKRNGGRPRLPRKPGQRQRAWEIATDFGFATVYDATYLALAELQGCEFWTADERLFNYSEFQMTAS